MEKIKTLLIILLLTSVIVPIALYSAFSTYRYNYIGVRKCAVCHGEDAIGNQYKLWQASPHAKAVRMLHSERAREIAKKISIKEPHNSNKCLKCHTTGKGKVDSLRSEGVGCEACHGPGSGYQSAGNHVNYSDPTRLKGYQKAISRGMYPILSITGTHLKNRERLCKSCHQDKRPCFVAEKKNNLMKKMTIQVVDKLKRGDVIFKHPLRR